MSQDEIDLVLETTVSILKELPITVEELSPLVVDISDVRRNGFPLNVVIDEIPEIEVEVDTEDLIRSTGTINLRGLVQRIFTFSRYTVAHKKTFGRTALTASFNRVTAGIVTSANHFYGRTASTFTFGKETSGISSTGGLATYGSGAYGDGTYGGTVAQGTLFGQTAFAISFNRVTAGISSTGSYLAYGSGAYGDNTYGGDAPQNLLDGQIDASFTFVKAVAGQKKTFGQIAASFTFIKAVAGVIPLPDAPSPELWWKLDELVFGDGTIADSSGKGHVGVKGSGDDATYGQPPLVPSAVGTSIHFNQASGFSASDLPNPTRAETIQLWMKAYGNDNWGFVAGFRNDSNSDFYIVQLGTGSGYEFRYRNSGGAHTWTIPNTALDASAPHHVVFANDPDGRVQIRIDKVTVVDEAGIAVRSNNPVFSVGQGGALSFRGNVDQVGYWQVYLDKAITDASADSGDYHA